jgi:site-specific recombinase XerD
LYIREGGKTKYISAKTRSWEQAERAAQDERDKRDPVKIELQKIAEREAAKEAAEALRHVPFGEALDQWIGGMKTQRSTSLAAYRSTVRRMRRWADSNGVASLQDVTRKMLDQWRSEWSPEAEAKQNQLALNSQAALLTRIKAFFAWATENELLDRNPALALDAITLNESQTWPLTPEQFEQVLESTRRYDAECRYESARVGQQLRAIFQVQRWTGLRIGDALALPKTALRGNRITLTTQKTKADMECILPDHVVAALTSLPRRPEEHPDYFFWSRACTAHVQTNKWIRKVKRLNRHLSLVNENGEPMEFRSHMLRDTYAVEMLLAGVPLEKVSKLLSHKSIVVTERYYARWVKSRLRQLEGDVVTAMLKMGASVGAGKEPRAGSANSDRSLSGSSARLQP